MSLTLSNLCAVRRGKELFYSFLEAKSKLFQSVGDSQLTYAMRFLGIEILACNPGEYRFFRERIPSDFHPFSLISEKDLLRLQGVLTAFGRIESTTPNFGLGLQFQSNPPAKSAFLERSIDLDFSATMPFSQPFNQTRLPQCAILQDVSSFCQSQGSRHHSTEPSLVASTNQKHSDNKKKTELVTVQSVVGERTFENEPSDNNSDRRNIKASSTLEASISDVRNLDTEFSSDKIECTEIRESGSKDDASGQSMVACSDKKRRASFTLLESEMSPRLLSHLAEVRQFYSANINCNRDGGPLQSSTLDKMFERISSFMWFLKNVKCLEPALSYCANPQLVQEFVNYMIDKRGLKSITCSRYISSIINVNKVHIDSQGSGDEDVRSDNEEKIRAVQRQLERIARRERVDEAAKKPQLEKVVYSELLEFCRELKWEVSEKTGVNQARSCHDLCLLLLYCSANPGRVKEFVTLRIYSDQNEAQLKDQNFICFKEDQSVELIEDAYKTRSTYGPNRTDLTPLTFLTYYLQLYRSKMRPRLLYGKEHDYFFVSQRGDPFSEASYSNYVSAMFEKYFNVKVTTGDIRKAVVNHFLTLPESGDQSLRESFATVMKHSVRTQKRYYDERPIAQKKSRALDFLASMASRGLGEESVELLSDSDEEGNVEYLPNPGEFVALVATNSTGSAPEVFVAKVVRLSEDRKIAILAEFSELRPGRYKLSAGRSYREPVNALVYPIDIVYLHSEGEYELRTSKIDIHRQVYKK